AGGPPDLPHDARARVALDVDVRSGLAPPPQPLGEARAGVAPTEGRARPDRNHDGPQLGLGFDTGDRAIEIVLVGHRPAGLAILALAPERRVGYEQDPSRGVRGAAGWARHQRLSRARQELERVPATLGRHAAALQPAR